MIDFEAKNVDRAYPSSPVEILGMKEPANAGDEFLVVENEVESKKISDFRRVGKKSNNTLALKDKTKIFDNESTKKELNVILKSDVQGSSEALRNAINKITH